MNGGSFRAKAANSRWTMSDEGTSKDGVNTEGSSKQFERPEKAAGKSLGDGGTEHFEKPKPDPAVPTANECASGWLFYSRLSRCISTIMHVF